MKEKIYNSRYYGEEVDKLLHQVQTGKIDTCQLGEMRYSTQIDNPFGEKYAMCSGLAVSTDDYPNALMVLPVKGLSTSKKVPYPLLTKAPYMEMSNTSFQITDNLIGKMRIIAIPPATETPTDEDYMAMYASMKMYVDISRDGETWTQVYEFPKKEGEVFGAANPLLVNGKLIFPLQTVKFDLANQTQTTEVGRLLVTSDFDSFQEWEELEMNIPGASTTQWEIKAMAYGQGTYLAILAETVGSQYKTALLKSTDLVTWEYAADVFNQWADANSDISLSAFFSGNRWLVQFGYFFVADSLSEIDVDHLSDGDGIANRINYTIKNVFYQELLGAETYIVYDNAGVYILNQDENMKWRSVKQNPPTGYGESEKYVAMMQMGEGTLSWLAFGNGNHYYVFPNGDSVETLSLTDGASGWQLNGVLKLGTKLFLLPNAPGNSPYLSSALAVTPGISQPGMMVAYIKLKE